MTLNAPWAMCALLAVAVSATPAVGQSFSDFNDVGQLEDARRKPSPLSITGHSFEPSIVYKLLGVTTPHVMASSMLGWTDNYLRQDPEGPGALRRELFARVAAGLRLDTELGDHRLELGYEAVATELIDSDKDQTLEQRAAGRLDLYATDVEGHVDLSWKRGEYAQSIQLRGIVRLDTYRLTAWTEGRLGRFGVRVGGFGEDVDYVRSSFRNLDSLSLGADVQVYARIQPKLRALLEYNWRIVNFDLQDKGTLNDYQAHEVLAGVDGTFTPKVSASLKLGVAYQDIEEGGPNVDNRNYLGYVARTSLTYAPYDSTDVTVSYSRSVDVSLNSNYLLTDDVRVSVTQLVWERKISVNVVGSYTHSEPSERAHIDRLRGQATVGYKIRQWLSVTAKYSYEQVVSQFSLGDYQVHEVGISVGIGL